MELGKKKKRGEKRKNNRGKEKGRGVVESRQELFLLRRIKGVCGFLYRLEGLYVALSRTVKEREREDGKGVTTATMNKERCNML